MLQLGHGIPPWITIPIAPSTGIYAPCFNWATAFRRGSHFIEQCKAAGFLLLQLGHGIPPWITQVGVRLIGGEAGASIGPRHSAVDHKSLDTFDVAQARRFNWATAFRRGSREQT